MQSELETRATKTDNGWQDHDGFIGPIPRKGPRSPGGGLVVRTPSIGGAENAACFSYPPPVRFRPRAHYTGPPPPPRP
jgi:hypothetical protein